MSNYFAVKSVLGYVISLFIMWIAKKSIVFLKNFSCRLCSNASHKNLIIENLGPITTIGLNNPHKKNCLNIATIETLQSALKEFDESEAKVAILHGENGNFCSGFDIDEVLEYGHEKFENLVNVWKNGPLSKKIVICAMSGFSVAEGFELALACDLRVIEDTAQMGFLGRRFGVPLSMGGGSRLSSLLGQSRAIDLVTTGRTIDGVKAHSWGLAARFVATGTAIGQSINLATSIYKYPQEAVLYDVSEITKYSNSDNSQLKCLVLNEITNNLPKFKEGIGKHGKSRNIMKQNLPSWEDDEIIVDRSKIS